MKVSYNALREMVDFDLTPVQLAERLTLVGFEVEELIDLATWADGVVVGQIVTCERHPNSDKLQVCGVDVGRGEHLTIVCGAANARAGISAPVAVVGTYLPIKGLTIETATLRGVVSQGMICSLAELGLAKKSDGIHIFEQDYPLGADVRPLLGLDDVILDITSTANRADALSLVGMAREVAAFTGGLLRLPITPMPLVPMGDLTVTLTAQSACPAYLGTVVTGLKLAPSPEWLVRKLDRAGIRSINNVVDITNYVLLEWGQPLHAFDLDRLPGRDLGVRFAQPGETLTTLDGVDRTLQPNNLLITSANQPVALAGVMGGANTEVCDTTVAIVLEAALFDPAAVRRSARAQGLRTEASARYERGVDFSALETALDRALGLLVELAGGTVVAQARVDQRSDQRPSILLRPSRVAQILGMAIEPERIEASLKGYGCDVVVVEDGYRVLVPGYRARDLQTEIDLIEEIARWVGYNEIPITLPMKSQLGRLDSKEVALRQIRSLLLGRGLTELYHICFTPLVKAEHSSKRAQQEARFQYRATTALLNPLSADLGSLRAELLPGLLAAYKFNLDQGNGPLLGFEIGRVFGPDYQEVDQLGGIMGGDPLTGDWQHRGQVLDFFAAKGIVENLALGLGLTFEYTATSSDPRFHPGRTAAITLAGAPLGIVGQIHPRLVKAEDLPEATFAFELDLGLLLHQVLDQRIQYQSFSSYPAVDRDIALFCGRETPVATLMAQIQTTAGSLLDSVMLFDEYVGANVPEGMRSLAFRLVYRATDRTLTDGEVNAVQEQVRGMLTHQFQAQLRS